MRLIKQLISAIGITILSLGTLSCGSPADSPITFKLKSGQAVLIPIAASTCKEEAVPAADGTTISITSKSFAFDAPQIEVDVAKMNQNASINIIGITIKIESPFISGGKYQCVIAGDELKYLYYNPAATSTSWDPTNIIVDTAALQADGTTASEFTGTRYWTAAKGFKSCPLRCGGVATTKEGAFQAPVLFELIAVSTVTATDGSLIQTPYKISMCYCR